jgi:hypothetical protein
MLRTKEARDSTGASGTCGCAWLRLAIGARGFVDVGDDIDGCGFWVVLCLVSRMKW